MLYWNHGQHHQARRDSMPGASRSESKHRLNRTSSLRNTLSPTGANAHMETDADTAGRPACFTARPSLAGMRWRRSCYLVRGSREERNGRSGVASQAGWGVALEYSQHDSVRYSLKIRMANLNRARTMQIRTMESRINGFRATTKATSNTRINTFIDTLWNNWCSCG